MRGSILGFDLETHIGAINGGDGKRYDFAIGDWHGSGAPRHGDAVEFEAQGGLARDVRLVERRYVRPTLAQLYFSPAGRVSRAQYWLCVVLPTGVVAVLLLAAIGYLATARRPMVAGLFVVLFLMFAVSAIWPLLAGMIKRAHDRDRPWPFALLLLVPLVQLWPLAELLLLRGTRGSNRFGAEPLSPAAPAAARRRPIPPAQHEVLSPPPPKSPPTSPPPKSPPPP